ncbi:MAG: HAMP domain-containing histidine kinase [bacterium]|nr:HAMP domain-containing histidine kinase [bacterium]MCM1376280.1 HAMP domain-containing histidine kinase [Muribaculum sp.]
MKNNRVIRRLALHIVQHLAAIGMAVMVGIIAVNSNIVVDNMYGDQIGYRVGLMDNAGEFEDSRIFTDVFRNAINDITRLAVIKGQLETNGRFEGSKVIGVTRFVNRISHKSDCLVNASYHLDELIRWGKYGLELQTVTFQSKFDFIVYFGYESVFDSYGYGEQLEQFDFSEEAISNILAWDIKNDIDRSGEEPNEDAEEFSVTDFDFMGQEEAYETAMQYIENIWGVDALFNRITVEMAMQGKEVYVLNRGGQEVISMEMLVPRYNTITDQSIAASCSNWPEYCMLEANVIETVETLTYNYALYQNQNDLYAQGKTNLQFFISTTTREGQEYYTNMDMEFSQLTDSEKTEYFRGLGKYVVYFPDSMLVESNANITEDEMFNNVSDYEYAFPKNTKLWIGVNTDFPIQKDQFYLAMDTYNSIIPHMWLILIFGIAFLLIWMGIGGYISYTTGKLEEEGKTVSRLYVFDRLPTEIFLFLLLLTGAGLGRLFGVIYENVYDTIFYRDSRATMQQLITAKQYILAIISGYGLLVSLYAGLFWYSLVRRMQCSALWRNSILHRVCSVIYRGVKMMLENHNAVIRTLMPYNIFLLANLLCVLVLYELRDASRGLLLIPLLFVIVLDGGVGIYIFRKSAERNDIIEGISRIRGGDIGYLLDSESLHGDNKELAASVNNIGDGIRKAVATSMKDERMQADLITNVSHDIKTPLTSIINYVDLLKREKIAQEPIRSYIAVLDSKAQRLKQLTDDLLEASRISSGNIALDNGRLDLAELLRQSLGEFSEKLEARGLQVMFTEPSSPAYIYADSRRMWRVVENLFNNICKYAMSGTRVYVDLDKDDGMVRASIKNISETALNFDPEELTERFVRGDVSRSSEGSGLGLSIAKNLTELQNGEFKIVLDGDLFKIQLSFQEYREPDVVSEPGKEEE